jgi:outer membrane murein-binding lipoprotein Lpp
MIVVFVVGVIVGFGFGSNPAKVKGLEDTVQQLTAENAKLKAQVGTLSAPAPQAPSAPAPAAPPTKQ